MNLPLVSIALCTYNGERFLAEQLDSLLAQDHDNLEIIAVDDASSDTSWDILQRYAARDARLKPQRNAHNLGFRANFERALRACSGEWMALCDQDDIWLPHKLRTLIAAANGASLVYCDSLLVDEHNQPLGRRVSDSYRMIDGSDARSFALRNCVSGHALIARRELVLRALPLPAHIYHDHWLAFVAAGADGLRYVDLPLVRFRQHADNASAFTGGRARATPRERVERETLSLECLAAHVFRQQAFFIELLRLWRLRLQGRTPWPLFVFLLRHRDAVFAMYRTAPALRWRHAFKYLSGVRA